MSWWNDSYWFQIFQSQPNSHMRMYSCSWWRFGENWITILTSRCNLMPRRFAPRRFAGCFAWCIARQSFCWRCRLTDPSAPGMKGFVWISSSCKSVLHEWRKMTPFKKETKNGHTLAGCWFAHSSTAGTKKVACGCFSLQGICHRVFKSCFVRWFSCGRNSKRWTSVNMKHMLFR